MDERTLGRAGCESSTLTAPVRCLCVLLLLAGFASAEDDRPLRWVKDRALQKRIHDAIDRGIAFLISTQHESGCWRYYDPRSAPQPSGRAGKKPDVGRFGDPRARRAGVAAKQFTAHDGGLTAVALYAMGASGIERDHPAVQKALRFLDKHPDFFDAGSPCGTYAASFLVLALTRLDAKKFGAHIRNLANRIATSQIRNGMWGYRLTRPKAYAAPIRAEGRGSGDGSNTQLAVLALWAAYSLAEWKPPNAVWQRIEAHYRKTQGRSGAWGYRPGRASRSNTMTAAGLACWVYARAALDGSESALQRARASATAQRGLKAYQGIMRAPNWNNYYLVYSIERVGTVLGLGDLSWYERGARVLIERQHAKRGCWSGQSLGADPGHAYETALAILFLSRATYPPRKGAVTPPDRVEVVSPSEAAPTIAKAKSHTRAFEIYLALTPKARAHAMRAMGARGPEMVDQLIGVLARDGRSSARIAALELVAALLDKRFLYLSDAPPEERKVMAAAIEATWTRMRPGSRWDPQRGRYVAK